MERNLTIHFNKTHTHDCDDCIYLGSANIGGHNDPYDFYVHVNGYIPDTELIARYGGNGSYICSLYSAVNEKVHNNILSMVKRLYLKSAEFDAIYFQEDTTYA